MSKSILLFGAGGHCASCIEVILSTHSFNIIGIVESPGGKEQEVSGIPVIGTDDDLVDLKEKCGRALITVGFVETVKVRKRLFTLLGTNGFDLPPIVASSAFKAISCKISDGTILMHQAMVNARASVGRNCIINSKALVEHDARIGDNCHVSTGAIVNGDCIIGEDCFLGSGSVIKHGVGVASGCIIGAGAVVVSYITEPGVYVGNPVRKIR